MMYLIIFLDFNIELSIIKLLLFMTSLPLNKYPYTNNSRLKYYYFL